MAYRGLGDRRKAEEHLRQRGEVDLPPFDPLMGELADLLQNAAAYETRGGDAIDDQRWADAVTNLRKASELAPNNAFTRLNLGTSLYMLDDAAGALEQFQAAVRLSPGLAKAHFGIGVIMESRGQDREAIDAFGAAVKYDPGLKSRRASVWPTRSGAADGFVSRSPTTRKSFDSTLRCRRPASGTPWDWSVLDAIRRPAIGWSETSRRFPTNPGCYMRWRGCSPPRQTIAFATALGH